MGERYEISRSSSRQQRPVLKGLSSFPPMGGGAACPSPANQARLSLLNSAVVFAPTPARATLYEITVQNLTYKVQFVSIQYIPPNFLFQACFSWSIWCPLFKIVFFEFVFKNRQHHEQTEYSRNKFLRARDVLGSLVCVKTEGLNGCSRNCNRAIVGLKLDLGVWDHASSLCTVHLFNIYGAASGV